MNNFSINASFGQASRNARPKRKRPAPLSIRLSDEEKAQLKREAGGGSVHALARTRLLAPDAKPAAPTRGGVKVDHAALAQILAMLGKSRLSSNMNQIAKAANANRFTAPADLQHKLECACADIRAMRITLSKALGIKPKE